MQSTSRDVPTLQELRRRYGTGEPHEPAPPAFAEIRERFRPPTVAERVGGVLGGGLAGAMQAAVGGPLKGTGIAMQFPAQVAPGPGSAMQFAMGKALERAGLEVDEWGEALVPDKAEELFTTKLSNAVGQGVGFMLGGGVAGAATGLPRWAVIATMGALTNAPQGYYEALEADPENPEKAWLAFALNMGVGTTEAIPLSRMMSRWDRALGGGLRRRIMSMGTQGAEEAVQESLLQQFPSNLIAQVIYDEERDLLQGMAEGGALGFLAGAILEGGGGLLLQRTLEEGTETDVPRGTQPTLTGGRGFPSPEEEIQPPGSQPAAIPPLGSQRDPSGIPAGYAPPSEPARAAGRALLEANQREGVVLGPVTPAQRRVSEALRESGAEAVFVQATGEGALERPGAYQEGVAVFDATLSDQALEERLFGHELSHHVRAAIVEETAAVEGPSVGAWERLYRGIQTLDPGGFARVESDVRAQYEPVLAERGLEGLALEDALRDEAVAGYLDRAGGVLFSERWGELRKEPGLLRGILDALVRLLNRIPGVQIKTSTEKRLRALRDELAKTELEAGIPTETLAEIRSLALETLTALRGRAPATAPAAAIGTTATPPTEAGIPASPVPSAPIMPGAEPPAPAPSQAPDVPPQPEIAAASTLTPKQQKRLRQRRGRLERKIRERREQLVAEGVDPTRDVSVQEMEDQLARLGAPTRPRVTRRALPTRQEQAEAAAEEEGFRGMRFALATPPFYSKLERVVEEKMGRQIPAAQLRGLLKAQGVKEEEITWSGFDAWLEGKETVTKEEALEFLQASNVEIKDVVMGAGETRYGQQWTEPGGEDYREHLMVLETPEGSEAPYDIQRRRLETDEEAVAWSERFGVPIEDFDIDFDTGQAIIVYQMPDPEGGYVDTGYYIVDSGNQSPERYHVPAYREFSSDDLGEAEEFLLGEIAPGLGLEVQRTTGRQFVSPHFEQRNIVAWMRYNTRETDDGKKVLFIEEIQSDWHQAGRKHGYLGPPEAPTPTGMWIVRQSPPNMAPFDYAPMTREEADRLVSAITPTGQDAQMREEIRQPPPPDRKAVPDAPFKKSWLPLAIKRTLIEAARMGADALAWTPGAFQVKRYGLSRALEYISWEADERAHRAVTVRARGRATDDVFGVTPEGTVVPIPFPSGSGPLNALEGERLSDVVGEEIAASIMDPLGYGDITFDADEPGPETSKQAKGQLAFYDQILPKAVKKLTKETPRSTFVHFGEEGTRMVPSVPVTEKLKAKALQQGFPRFAMRGRDFQRLEELRRRDPAVERELPTHRAAPVGEEPEKIAAFRALDEWREEMGRPERVTREAQMERATTELSQDYDGVETSIRSKLARNEPLEPWEHVAAARIISNLMGQGIHGGETDAAVDAYTLADQLREVRANTARSLGVLTDAMKSPTEELAEALATPSVRTQVKIQKIKGAPRLTEEVKQRRILDLLKKEADLNRQLRKALVEAGLDPYRLSPAQLADPLIRRRIANIAAPLKGKTWGDKFIEYRVASMLTGPLTHAANISGNSIMIASEQHTKRLAETLVNTFVRAEDAATVRETVAFYAAFLRAFLPAARNLVQSFKTEEDMWEIGLQRMGVPLKRLGVKIDTGNGPAIAGTWGRIARTSLRVLRATDSFFKTMAGIPESTALAYRKAKNEGLKGDELSRRITELLQDGSQQLHIDAHNEVLRLTFQDPAQEGSASDQILRLAHKVRRGLDVASDVALQHVGAPAGGDIAGRMVLPFLNTPFRIFQRGIGLAAAPLKVPLKGAVTAATLGRAGYATRGEFVSDTARAMVSIALLLMILDLVDGEDEEGRPLITGTGGRYERNRAAFEQRSGVGAYQIKMPWGYMDYRRLEPFAVTTATIVDLLQKDRDEDVLGTAVSSIFEQTKDKTFLQTWGDIWAAMDRPGSGRTARFLENTLVTPMIPNIVRQPAREMDPFIRVPTIREYEDQTALEAAGESLLFDLFPSGQLNPAAPPVRYDVWGRSMMRFDADRNPAGRFILKALIQQKDVPEQHRLDLLVRRFNERVDNGDFGPDQKLYYPSSSPATYATHKGKRIYWTDEEYSTLQREAGTRAAERLRLTSLDYDNPTERETKLITREITRARREVRDELLRARDRSPQAETQLAR